MPMEEPLPELGPMLLRAVTTLSRRADGRLAEGLGARYTAPAFAPEALAAYTAFFGGFASALPLSALYPLAQRAQLALMLRSGFPFPVVGLVHVANAMQRVGPFDPGAAWGLDVACRAPESAGADAPVRVAFDVTLVQAGSPRATCRSLYQVRRAGPRPAGPRPAPEPETALSGAREPWRLPADEGRRYARLSGDYNPIHLSPWTSRLFGFNRPILHGMDAAARVQAGIERGTGLEVSALEIAFKRPIALPASVEWVWEPAGDGGGRYAIESADGTVRHLEGRYATGLTG